jgi:aquaporin Z
MQDNVMPVWALFNTGQTKMFRKLSAEAFGTFWLVFGGCGSALIAAGFPDVGIGFVGVSLAFGLTVLTMAYAVGGISGGHFNPAVSLGLAIAGRFEYRELIPYWIAQLVGGIVAAVLLYLICSGKAGWMPGGFASNGYDANSPDGYSLLAALITEIVLTGFFLIVILGSTSKVAPVGFAPIAIGLALTLIHRVSIPVTNTSVNPARPMVGAALGAAIWKYVLSPGESVGKVGREK